MTAKKWAMLKMGNAYSLKGQIDFLLVSHENNGKVHTIIVYFNEESFLCQNFLKRNKTS